MAAGERVFVPCLCRVCRAVRAGRARAHVCVCVCVCLCARACACVCV
jgi:hypothetical protein